ncbi:MAG: hypothetical protein AAF483_02390 [Planctomycetota bacterium]
MKRRTNHRLFQKLASEERGLTKTQFLSPVLRGGNVQVRIAGVVMSLSVAEPAGFEGWGVFQPLSPRAAKWIRSPTMREKSEYLKLFPSVRFVLSHQVGGDKTHWLGLPANQSERQSKQGSQNLVPIQLVGECERFETIVARFDGHVCWFERRDSRVSLRVARHLREQLQKLTKPEQLQLSECTKAEMEVYRKLHRRLLAEMRDPDEDRISEALKRGGGQYISHREVGDKFTVMYVVNGESHHSTVDKSTLAVQSAGICLEGMDRDFDLQSLVGVIAEGQNRGEIFHV